MFKKWWQKCVLHIGVDLWPQEKNRPNNCSCTQQTTHQS